MNIKVQKAEEAHIRTVDYNLFLEGFQTLNQPALLHEPIKIRSNPTHSTHHSRPFTSEDRSRPTTQQISQGNDYIQNLINQKTLLNIEYEALKGRPKF